MMPTTPEGQDTAEEVTEKEGQKKIEVKSKEKKEENEDKSSEMMAQVRTEEEWLEGYRKKHGDLAAKAAKEYLEKLQEEHPEYFELQEEDDEEKPYTPPVAVPPTYEDFPNTDPLPPDYRGVVEGAQKYLEEMPVKSYPAVQPGEAHQVFTIKKLRSFENAEELLTKLKLAIVPTLEANTEDTAWKLYWQQAIKIFQDYGFEQPSPQLRSSLIASFRQARQNALNEGLYQGIIDDPAVVGLRLKEDPHVKEHHLDEIAWKDIAIPKEHKELQLGGRLRIPLNFGCLHHYEKVYDPAKLTPEADWPKEFPGETYKYYAQPEPKGEEI